VVLLRGHPKECPRHRRWLNSLSPNNNLLLPLRMRMMILGMSLISPYNRRILLRSLMTMNV
jgi:hypothetical protein